MPQVKSVIQYGGLMVIMVALSIIPSSVFAQEDSFEKPIISVFEWFNELMTENIQNSDMKNSTKQNLQSALDTGTDAGATGTSLWFKVHSFVVEAIYAGTTEAGLNVDKDIISIVAIVIVFGGLFMLLLHLIKHNTKIAVIVIAVLLILGITGVIIEF